MLVTKYDSLTPLQSIEPKKRWNVLLYMLHTFFVRPLPYFYVSANGFFTKISLLPNGPEQQCNRWKTCMGRWQYQMRFWYVNHSWFWRLEALELGRWLKLSPQNILDPILGISVILFYVKYVQFHVINTIWITPIRIVSFENLSSH